jgi:23S rRNA pseudouridine2605 synthase
MAIKNRASNQKPVSKNSAAANPGSRPAEEKIQKVLARAGLGSRREIERWVAEGRVSINGRIATLGARTKLEDDLKVDGRLVSNKQLTSSGCRVLVYNKPQGEICTRTDPEGRPTVFDNLPTLPSGRWIVVGRLDINTSGLLLFTTDGELANKLMHPSSEMDREYVVRVMGQVEDEAIERLKSGVMLEDGEARFTDITAIKNKKEEAINQWFYCSLIEGRNREVRRLWESQGYKVSRLKRVRFGPVHLLAKVKEGAWMELSESEMQTLYADVHIPYQKSAPMDPKDQAALERQSRKKLSARKKTSSNKSR